MYAYAQIFRVDILLSPVPFALKLHQQRSMESVGLPIRPAQPLKCAQPVLRRLRRLREALGRSPGQAKIVRKGNDIVNCA